MCRFFSLLILISVSANLIAQKSDFAFRNYTAINGLPQSQVSSIVEDNNGYLWMGTLGGGLARFDGQSFKVYTTLDGLFSNIVNHVVLDSKQNLWIVHPRGITKYDGVTFKTFQASPELSKMKMVRKAFVFNDTVFVTSAPGLLGKIYQDSVYYWSKEYAKGKLISRVHQLQSGQLCLFLNDGTVVLKTSNGDKHIGKLPESTHVYSVYDFGTDLRFSLYSIMDKSNHTYRVDPVSESLEIVASSVAEPVIFFDQAARTYWLRKDESILTLRDEESALPETVLKDVEINQILPDKEGNIWIATNGSGLYKYFHQDFSKCSSDNMKGVMSITKDKEGATWIGTIRGLWKIKKGKVSNYNDKNQPSRNMINYVAEAPDGAIWAGSWGGLGKYDSNKDAFTWLTPEDGLSSYSVINICFDEKGYLWAGTGSGLNFYDGNNFVKYTTDQGLLSSTVNSLYYSKKLKTLFVGNEYGVNTIIGGKVGQLPIKGFENTTIYSIQPYRDSLLLLGSGGAGFSVYDPATTTSHFITTHDGLISDFIYFIAADEQNTIWVGTEKGISRVILNSKYEIIENIHFDHENGLEGVETNQNAFYLEPKEKFFGLIDGLYQFNEFEQTQFNSFQLHLTSVDIFYGEDSSRKYADSLSGFFKIPQKPIFPSDKNHITFSFNRVEKRYSKSVRFKYMLKNYDKAWSLPSPNKQVTYSNLPPGDYEFVAVATNSQGSWSTAQLRYPFIVKAPFYQTATFVVISFLMLVGIIIFVAYLRVRQRVEKTMMLERIRVKEQESLRKEIARDFHDEMGNQLSRIINYVSLLKLNGSSNGNGNGVSNLNDLYTKVENSAKYLYTGTRDFIWSIDPVNDELSKLFIHIRDFGEKLFEEKDIQFRANNEVKEKIKLPYGFSREVNLVFKEVMTNTFKYSQAKNATLTLQRVGAGYEIYFEDDGIGFNASDIEKLNGLKNIRERADKIQAVLRIRSKDGAGTRISLNFQFTKIPNYGITL